jgi:hypothetical protein
MYDWLNNETFSKDNKFWCVIGYNEKTNKMICESYDDCDEDKKQEHEKREIAIFDSGLEFNLDYNKDYEKKLFDVLCKNPEIDINILSTESGDDWFVEIYRTESNIPTHLYGKETKLVSYVLTFLGEQTGKILSLTICSSPSVGKYKPVDEFTAFSEWINDQVESVGVLNSSDYFDNTVKAIVTSEAFIGEQEYKSLTKMFYDKW